MENTRWQYGAMINKEKNGYDSCCSLVNSNKHIKYNFRVINIKDNSINCKENYWSNGQGINV
jgi:hypothetical protein